MGSYICTICRKEVNKRPRVIPRGNPGRALRTSSSIAFPESHLNGNGLLCHGFFVECFLKNKSG